MAAFGPNPGRKGPAQAIGGPLGPADLQAEQDTGAAIRADGKVLNIAGDYIGHGIRHRASELVTRELGHQSEIDVARRLAIEASADRLTRLDRMLIAEQRDQGLVDLRPGEGQRYLVRQNRHLLIDRPSACSAMASRPRRSRDAGLCPTAPRPP